MNDETRTAAAAGWLGIGLPLLVTIIGVYLQLSWWDQLPNPVAVHWGANGVVDGFGSQAMVPWMTALLGVVLPLLMTIPVLVSLRKGVRGPNLRFMVAIAAFFSGFMVWLLTGSLYIQRGLADAAETGSIAPVLLAGLGAGALAGVLAWVIQPRQETELQSQDAAPLSVGPSERAVWTAQVGMSAPIMILLGLGAVGSAVGAAAVWFSGEHGAAVALSVVAVLIGVIAFGLSRATVTVDERGLLVKAALGWPKFEVPTADVASVATQEVSGLAEFGGYGIRAIPGAFGVILQSGDAISVTRRNGRRFVVTVDDAATGAGLLQAYAQRRS